MEFAGNLKLRGHSLTRTKVILLKDANSQGFQNNLVAAGALVVASVLTAWYFKSG